MQVLHLYTYESSLQSLYHPWLQIPITQDQMHRMSAFNFNQTPEFWDAKQAVCPKLYPESLDMITKYVNPETM